MSKIMAIAAHPGDALFTMGATVAAHIQHGGRGVFLNLSLGERGHPTLEPAAYGEMQRVATNRAAAILGAESAFIPYLDAEIPASEQAALAVCDCIRQHRPDVVLTHWKGSWHKDHRNTFQVVRDAIFYAELRSLIRELPAHRSPRVYFAENWEDAEDYQFDILLETTSVHDKWMEACAVFPMWRGETGLIRYDDYYGSLAKMRGCLGGFDYAVGLMSDPDQRLKKIRSFSDTYAFL
jgi:LmbE family N-acetylglucosaminyl deacetylase